MQTFGDVINFLRFDTLRDREAPYLWTDETLYECVAQAHDEFAEEVQYIRDSTTSLAEIILEEGVDFYPLPSVVLSTVSAKLDGSLDSLARASSTAFDGYTAPPEIVQWLSAINYGVALTGTPQVFSTDSYSEGAESGAALRVWPIPDAAAAGKTLRLRVVRLPSVRCAEDTLDQIPEIPRQYIMALVHGAAAVAYNMQDTDGGDPNRYQKQRELFDGYIRRAQRGVRRKHFQPLSWGFGRGGF